LTNHAPPQNRLKKLRQTLPPLEKAQQDPEQGDEDDTHPHPRVESAISEVGPVAEAMIVDCGSIFPRLLVS
jgi:hypothetical protein